MRNSVITGATQKRPFGVSLNEKASRLKTFAIWTASDLSLRLFFGYSMGGRRPSRQLPLVFTITGYLCQAGFWTGFLIDGLGRTSTSSVESKLLLFPAP